MMRIIFYVFLGLFGPCCNGISTYQKLMDDVFANYSAIVRPTHNVSEPTHVYVEMKLVELIDIDTKQGFMEFYSWHQEIWFDDFLYWDPADYDGIDHIFVPEDKVWRPDTYINENLLMDSDQESRSQPIRIHTDPETKSVGLKLSNPVRRKLSCFDSSDAHNFPNDIQKCVVTMYSWTHTSQDITYESVLPHMGYYVENSEWILLSVDHSDHLFDYELFIPLGEYKAVGWSEITFTFTFQRKKSFLMWALFPTAVLVQFCLMAIFSISKNNGNQSKSEKVAFGALGVISLILLLLIVSDIIHIGSSPRPKIFWYIVAEVTIVGVATVLSVFLVYINFCRVNCGKPVPKWMQNFCCCFCLCRGKKTRIANNNKAMMLQSSHFFHLSSLFEDLNSEKRLERDWAKVFSCISFLCWIIFAAASLCNTLIFALA